MIFPIVAYGDPVLKKRAIEIDKSYPSLAELIDNMYETMHESSGVGLAAPQIGIHQRVIVIDVAGKDDPPALIAAINPVIVHAEGETFEEEGCLSVPKYAANVRRHASIVVKGLNLDGEEVTWKADGLLAIAFQHEIDHLDGILFVDHISQLKKEIFRRKYRRSQDQEGND